MTCLLVPYFDIQVQSLFPKGTRARVAPDPIRAGTGDRYSEDGGPLGPWPYLYVHRLPHVG